MKKKVLILICSALAGLTAFAGNELNTVELTKAEQQLVQNNNDFAFRLFREARGAENKVLSPLSVTYALGLINNGATGDTQKEINMLLGANGDGLNAETINSFCRKMLDASNLLDKNTQVIVANNIYFNNGSYGGKIKSKFMQAAKKYYDAEPQMRDLYVPETLDEINRWVSDRTKGMITDLLSKEDLQPNLVSFLLNAIYFKGAWTKPFDKNLTETSFFDGQKATATMMTQKNEFLYTENDLYQAVQLPYGNGSYLMTVFLPREDKTLDDLVAAISGKNWNADDYQRYMVTLKLPRIITDTDQDLQEAMKSLGVYNAFLDTKDALGFLEFCFMGDDESKSDPVWISLMKQSAKLRLDEVGTEAAAATATEVTGKSAPSTKQAIFKADRPFLYTISECTTGAIFFLGQYMGDGAAQSGENNGINEIEKMRNVENEKVYDLLGRRVNSQLKKGVYISNGRAFVIK